MPVPSSLQPTPVERLTVGNFPLYVKREDLCCPLPGPPFSKMRGVIPHVASRPESVMGVLDTYHSKAGWAVAYACSLLGKRCVNFFPEYKYDPHIREQQKRAAELGAELVPLPAGRSAILYHQARKKLAADYPDSYLMPNALKLRETVEETAAEFLATDFPEEPGTVVVSMSSGTIAAGVLRGLVERYGQRHRRTDLLLHMGYSRSLVEAKRFIVAMAEVPAEPLTIVDEGYTYKETARIRPGSKLPPFPCSPYYDLKAWEYMLSVGPELFNHPVVFWNVGA